MKKLDDDHALEVLTVFKEKWIFDEGDPDHLFELFSEIAKGSQGSVYVARYVETDEIVALKILTNSPGDEFMSSLYTELYVLSNCDHDNILKLVGTWQKENETFIALDFCGGGCVADFGYVWDIEMTEEQIGLICKDTLTALYYLHTRHIIHRDIKGANILLKENGDVILADFGISAILPDAKSKSCTLLGTPYWMAPEIVSNKYSKSPYDIRADIWALGITLIELAEKQPPLAQIHPMRALLQIPIRDPPSLNSPKWSADFRDFLSCCLQKEPEKRSTIPELLEHNFITKTHDVDRSILTDLIKLANVAREEIAEREKNSTDPVEATSGSMTYSWSTNEDEFSSFSTTSSYHSENKIRPEGIDIREQSEASRIILANRSLMNRSSLIYSTTKHEQELVNMKFVATRKMRVHLKELRDHMRVHNAKEEKNRLKNKKELDEILRKKNGRSIKAKSTYDAKKAKIKKICESDYQQLIRNHEVTSKQLKKEHEEQFRAYAKEISSTNAKLLSEFTRTVKSTFEDKISVVKTELKRKKTSSEKKEKTKSKEYQETQNELLYDKEINILKYKYELKIQELKDLQKFSLEQKKREHDMQYFFYVQDDELNNIYMSNYYSVQKEFLNEVYQIKLEYLFQKNIKEKEFLDNEFSVRVAHMKEQELVELENLKKIMMRDEAIEYREFKKMRALAEKLFMKKQKDWKAKNKKKLEKQALNEYLNQWKEDFISEQDILEKNFLVHQQLKSQEEAKNLMKYYSKKLEELGVLQQEKYESLGRGHVDIILKSDTTKNQKIKMIEWEKWKYTDSYKKQKHIEHLTIIKKNHRESEQIYLEGIEEEIIAVYSEYNSEIVSACTEHEKNYLLDNLSELLAEERDDLIDQMTKSLLEIQEIHANELESLKNQHKSQRKQLKKNAPIDPTILNTI